MSKRLIETKEKFRLVFLSGSGPEVLGVILSEYCCFFGPCKDDETAVRQTVGREILSIMDLWSGSGQTANPQQFINKLAAGSVETIKGRRRETK